MKLKEWFLSLKNKQKISENKKCERPKRFFGAIVEDYSVTEAEYKELQMLLKEHRERNLSKSLKEE